jgi:hypothetical protein
LSRSENELAINKKALYRLSMEENWPETVGTYSVVDGRGDRLLTTKDLFRALTALKDQEAGAKLLRDGDGMLLAYTTGHKPPRDARMFY